MRQLALTLALSLACALALTACVETDDTLDPSTRTATPTLDHRGDPALTTAALGCVTNNDCGYGARCMYGTCTSGGSNCMSDACACGHGTVCYTNPGPLQNVCGPDFGPGPECQCDAHCGGGGTCAAGLCEWTSGGPGGGGGGGGPGDHHDPL